MNQFLLSPTWRTRVGLLSVFLFLTGWGLLDVMKTAHGSSQSELVVTTLDKKLHKRFTNPANPKEAEIKIIPYATPAHSAKGKFKTIIIRSSPAAIRKMPVESIAMRADDVTIDVTKLLRDDDIITLKCGKTELEAVVTEENINTLFARGPSTRPMNLKANFVDGKIKIAGHWKLFMFKGPIQTTGKLVLTKENNLNFNMESLKLNNAEAPDSMKKQFMDRINPIVDFGDVPFQPRISTITFKGNKVYVST